MPDLQIPFRQGQQDNNAAVPKTGTPITAGNSWLARVLARPDPLLQFDWDATIQVGGLSHKPEYVETVNVPGMQTAADAVYRASTKIYVATTYEYGALSMRFYEDVHMTTTKFLRSWAELIHLPNGDHGIPADYKGYMEVYPKTPDGGTVAIFKCIGIFPTQHPPLGLGTASEPVALECEFSCDAVEITFLR